MKKFTTAALWAVLGGLLAIAGLELLLRGLPVSKGLARTADETQWPLHNYTAHATYTYSFGWDMKNAQHGRTNNFGQVAPFDYGSGQAPVVVIGDSFVESLMNPYADTLQAQLAGLMKRPEAVYGLGVSGLSVSDYLRMAESASQAFRPSAQVIVIVDGDFTESLLKRRGWTHFEPQADGRLRNELSPQNAGEKSGPMQLLTDSSLYRYLRSNLLFSPTDISLFGKNAHAAQPAPISPVSTVSAPPDARVLAAIDFFLAELQRNSAVSPACTVFLLDAERYPLYGLPAAQRRDAPELIQHFTARARALGMQVSELGPRFAEHYKLHQQRFDHSPFDRHWNRLGHTIAAQEAWRQLQSCPALLSAGQAGAAALRVKPPSPDPVTR